MRYLGIDYGDKKIGLAFGDDGSGVAVPLDVIDNPGEGANGRSPLLQDLAKRIESEAIDEIVVGVPLPTVEGSGSKQLEKTRDFIKQLSSKVSVPVHEEDERYSTTEAIRLQREQGAGAEDDALAAMLVLQAYLDEKRGKCKW